MLVYYMNLTKTQTKKEVTKSWYNMLKKLKRFDCIGRSRSTFLSDYMRDTSLSTPNVLHF